MAGFSDLYIAIQEADQLRLDLGRARMILRTAEQLVSEERTEINQLRASLFNLQKDGQRLAEENELLRQQLFEVSSVRSRRLGLTPRDERPATIPIMQDT
jgi:hypothetical protein